MSEKITPAKSRSHLKKLLAKGFKQVEIAVLLRRSTRMLTYYLSGERPVPIRVGAKILELYERPVDDVCKLITKARER